MLYGASTYIEILHHTDSDSGHFSRVINLHAFVEDATTCFLARLHGSSSQVTHASSSAGLAREAGWRVATIRHVMRHSYDGCLLRDITPSIFSHHTHADETSQDKLHNLARPKWIFQSSTTARRLSRTNTSAKRSASNISTSYHGRGCLLEPCNTDVFTRQEKFKPQVPKPGQTGGQQQGAGNQAVRSSQIRIRGGC